jgi:hypothetical protein
MSRHGGSFAGEVAFDLGEAKIGDESLVAVYQDVEGCRAGKGVRPELKPSEL